MSSDSFEMCRTQYDLKTTTHKHTCLHFMTSFRYKQHVAGSSSDVPAPGKTGSRIYTNPGLRLSIDHLYFFVYVLWLVRDVSNTIWLEDYYTQTHTSTLHDFLPLQATRWGQQLRLDHACVWARACVALLVVRNSQWHTLPSHNYHRSHPAYSTHSVNTQ